MFDFNSSWNRHNRRLGGHLEEILRVLVKVPGLMERNERHLEYLASLPPRLKKPAKKKCRSAGVSRVMSLDANRLSALQTCLDRGWKSGSVLISKTWKTARRIQQNPALDVGTKDIKLALRVAVLKADGQIVREESLFTFPPDVEERT